MGTSVQRLRFGLTFLITAALVFGLLLVGRAVSGSPGAGPTASSVIVPAAARVKGRQVRIKVKGQRFGKKAKVTLKGYRGKAKGVKRTVRVKKTKTVKRLKPGKYKIIATQIRKNGGVAKAKRIKPRRVTVTKNRGASVTITYQQIKKPAPTPTPVGHITSVSADKRGNQASHGSYVPVFSPDGQRIAFYSLASNLVPGDTNETHDVFVKNLVTGAIAPVSADKDGRHGDDDSTFSPVFSPDGKKIAFASYASNLVRGDTNYKIDVFVKNLVTGAISRVSTDKDGKQGNEESREPTFSPDGKKITFGSDASKLVPGDTNKATDVFMKNLATGAITRVSTDRDGKQGNQDSSASVFSPDGKKIAFGSGASNLVPGDTNKETDVFVKVLLTGAITRVSTDKEGQQGNNSSREPIFSPDGKKIAYWSLASNLVPGDTNNAFDVFVTDLVTGAITLVSADKDGHQGNQDSRAPAFSPDGKKITFGSGASNLVPGDTNDSYDVFVKDLVTGAITRVSTDEDGHQGNQDSREPAFSPDGKKITLHSHASNLVPGDTNNASDVFVKTIG